MNDDIDGAYAALRKGNSSFHRLAAAVSFFIRSVIGLEQQVMAEALDLLNSCESKAWDDQKAAERRGARGDSIYLPGTEYELVRAESQLMGAVVGMLQESLVEAIRAFISCARLTSHSTASFSARIAPWGPPPRSLSHLRTGVMAPAGGALPRRRRRRRWRGMSASPRA